MRIKRFMTIVGIILLAFAVVACSRSASALPLDSQKQCAPPKATAGEAALTIYATKTAMAQNSINSMQLATPMPIPEIAPVPTKTPRPPAPQPTPIDAMAVPPAPTESLPTTYTLQKGELPYCIARRFDLNPSELCNLNNLNCQSNQSAVGLTLKIPQSGKHFPSNRALQTHPTTYTVAAGDTIYSIACKFGDVDPMVIARVNGLAVPYMLTAGQKLQIP
jgi:LysM repeat protein